MVMDGEAMVTDGLEGGKRRSLLIVLVVDVAIGKQLQFRDDCFGGASLRGTT
jgi:hypothetical protein